VPGRAATRARWTSSLPGSTTSFAASPGTVCRTRLRAARSRLRRWCTRPTRVDLDEVPAVASGREWELIALDDALTALAEIDPRKARVIELRFFGGLSVEETAEVLKVSQDTVMRDWRLARAWLLDELSGRS
jgi:RNA polymerase sigma factor (TIGR02999 family)